MTFSFFGMIWYERLNTYSLIILHMKLLKFVVVKRRSVFIILSFIKSSFVMFFFHPHKQLLWFTTEYWIFWFFSDTLRSQPIPDDWKEHFWRHWPGWSIGLLFGFRWFSFAGKLLKNSPLKWLPSRTKRLICGLPMINVETFSFLN